MPAPPSRSCRKFRPHEALWAHGDGNPPPGNTSLCCPPVVTWGWSRGQGVVRLHAAALFPVPSWRSASRPGSPCSLAGPLLLRVLGAGTRPGLQQLCGQSSPRWPVFTQVAVGSLCSGKEPTWVFAWLSASWPVRLTRLTPRGVMLKLSQMRRARVTSHWPPRPFEPGHFPAQQVFQKLAPLPLLFWSQPPPPRALLPRPPRATTEPRGRGG